ncbi:unnamed protein product [Trichobilharzia szidati]|nr:unnamed protein product [Trichobilharzia szidati]
MTRGGQLAISQSKSAYGDFRRDHDSHERHSSSRKHRRRSRSRSHERDKELRIQMKPLVLASENDSNRQSEINYIEGSSFIQKGFSSSRKLATSFQMIKPDSQSCLAGKRLMKQPFLAIPPFFFRLFLVLIQRRQKNVWYRL